MENLPALNENQVELLISQAIDKNVPVETMERLLAMRKELKQEYAVEQFNLAMAQFQNECPIVKKNKAVKNNSGSVVYLYAPIDSIVRQVKPLIFKYKFNYRIDTHVVPRERVIATCIVTHELGHSISVNVDLPLVERTKLMTDAQQESATMTLAIRRAFCNAFGIMTGDEDTDAKKEESSATEQQIEAIRSLLVQLNMKEITVLERFRVGKLEELSFVKASNAIKLLQSRVDLKQKDKS